MVRALNFLTAALAAAPAVLAESWQYQDDASWFDALDPVPSDVDLFDAYKRVFLSARDETIAWWYMGLSIPVPDGLPQVPGIKSQTIQAWRIQHESETRLRADWSEIIILADFQLFQSGQDITSYYNPTSGINATVPNYYYDGPITYYIEKNGSGISVELLQPGAQVKSVTVKAGIYNDRILFRQVETKVRSGSNLVSTLIAVGNLDDVRCCKKVENVKANGYYAADFRGNISSIFGYPNGTVGETRILGNMDKGNISDPLLYPTLWGKYQARFPEFFWDGAISPNWTSILTKAGLSP